MLLNTFVAAVLASAPLASAKKPVMKPTFPGGKTYGLEPYLWNNLHPTRSSFDTWGHGWLPESCKNMLEGVNKDDYKDNKLNIADVEAFNIRYTDCGTTWTFCRHKDAALSQIDMIDMFGRLPVHMRGYVRHIIAGPGRGRTSSGAANSDMFLRGIVRLRDLILMIGLNLNNYAAVIAEDSETDGPVRPMYYLADMVIVALADKVIPGGIGTTVSSWDQIFHGYATLQWQLGDVLIPGGTCGHRRSDSPPVAVATKRSRVGPAPDVSPRGDVEIIPAQETNTMIFVSENEDGTHDVKEIRL